MIDYKGYDRISDMNKYSKSIIMKNQLKTEGIDVLIDDVEHVAIIRNNQNPMSESKEDRSFIVDMSTEVKCGSYIKCDDLYYIVITGIDKYKDYYKTCKIRECNQTLNLKGWTKPIPCWGTNTSYGVKGKIDTDFFTITDGKIQFKVQKNKDTDMIIKGTRLMFNNSDRYVYSVVECENVLTQNIYVITVEKTEFNPKDDMVNNIAYNEYLEVDVPINPNPDPIYTYNIVASSGDLTLKRYNTNTFRIIDSYGNDVSGVWDITIDYNSVSEDFISIKEKGDNYIKLINNKGFSALPIKLKFKKNINLITVEIGLVK